MHLSIDSALLSMLRLKSQLLRRLFYFEEEERFRCHDTFANHSSSCSHMTYKAHLNDVCFGSLAGKFLFLSCLLCFVMNKNKASGVAWVKPAEPSFLKKFKSDSGYKEGPNVDTKRQVMPTPDDDSGSDREDELPQVVVLKGGDLTAEDVKKLKDEMRTEGGAKKDDDAADGKILFKKPAKRSSSDKFQGITASSSKKKKTDGGGEEEEEEEKKKSGKKVKNNSLLSFGGEEEEEED